MTLEELANLSNLGIHVSQEDIQEAELRAGGWSPMAAHHRSAVWRSPEGVLTPGPSYAWSVMKGPCQSLSLHRTPAMLPPWFAVQSHRRSHPSSSVVNNFNNNARYKWPSNPAG